MVARVARQSSCLLARVIARHAQINLKLAIQATNACDRIMCIELAERQLAKSVQLGGN